MTTGVNRLQKHSWLRHICISHKECEEWLDLMDLDLMESGTPNPSNPATPHILCGICKCAAAKNVFGVC